LSARSTKGASSDQQANAFLLLLLLPPQPTRGFNTATFSKSLTFSTLSNHTARIGLPSASLRAPRNAGELRPRPHSSSVHVLPPSRLAGSSSTKVSAACPRPFSALILCRLALFSVCLCADLEFTTLTRSSRCLPSAPWIRTRATTRPPRSVLSASVLRMLAQRRCGC
jgi:hypothetical protein